MAAPPISPTTLQALTAYGTQPNAVRGGAPGADKTPFVPQARTSAPEATQRAGLQPGNDAERAPPPIARETLIAIQSAASALTTQATAAPTPQPPAATAATPQSIVPPGSTLNLKI